MHLKVRKPTKLTRGNVTVTVRPHQTIQLPDAVGKRLLGQAPDRVKRVRSR